MYVNCHFPGGIGKPSTLSFVVRVLGDTGGVTEEAPDPVRGGGVPGGGGWLPRGDGEATAIGWFFGGSHD
jgi:hypothetical protein